MDLDYDVIFGDAVLIEAFETFVDWADTIDICYAWANSGRGEAAHWKLLPLAKVRRAVIGTAFAQTEPRALELLNDVPGRLRVVINSEGTFHPKLIVGRNGDEARALIGSANFTNAAFSINTECTVQIRGHAESEPFLDLRDFVDQQWSQGVPLDLGWLREYTVVWEQARRRKIVVPRAKIEITSMSSLDISWDAYVELVRNQHERPLADGNKVRVFGAHPSYFNEIEESARIFQRTPKFADTSRPDRQFLMGMGKSSGFIGTMRAAGYAKQVAGSSPELIGAGLDRIPRTGEVPMPLVVDVLGQMMGVKGVKIGVVSRFLAVKRPDLFVSVNNGSKPQLARLIGGRRIEKAQQYVSLLEYIWGTDWHRSERPEDADEALIWERRAALLDAALYEQVGK